MSRPSYIAVEQGKKELSLSEAQKIADIFGISLKDMETGEVPDYEKYKEMILSFLRFFSLGGDGKIPKTKLAKLLYLAIMLRLKNLPKDIILKDFSRGIKTFGSLLYISHNIS
jgi:DNA-binding XRE family transcriptional regulator